MVRGAPLYVPAGNVTPVLGTLGSGLDFGANYFLVSGKAYSVSTLDPRDFASAPPLVPESCPMPGCQVPPQSYCSDVDCRGLTTPMASSLPGGYCVPVKGIPAITNAGPVTK